MTDITEVLAMDECKYLEWAKEEGLITEADYKHYFEGGIPTRMILADLAFRKRNEAIKKYGLNTYLSALEEVRIAHRAICVVVNLDYPVPDKEPSYYFGCVFAQPIHWILAAIKAKEMSK